MSSAVLQAKARTNLGSADSRRIRVQGQIPGVIYSSEKGANQHIQFGYDDFARIYTKSLQHQSFKIDAGGKQVEVLVREVSTHPVTKRLSHVDFYEVGANKPVFAKIPVVLKGTPAGVRIGGILEYFVPELKVRCNSSSLMNQFELDVSNLQVNEAVYIRDLKLPSDFKVMNKPSQCVVRVTPSRATKMDAATTKPGKK